jgi:hypothetical protein
VTCDQALSWIIIPCGMGLLIGIAGAIGSRFIP